MTFSGRTAVFSALLALMGAGVSVAQTATPSDNLFSAMRWREIGPMRAGRTRALAGVPSEPSTFYIGAVGGGVFKTTDAGETWHSLWDNEPTGTIRRHSRSSLRPQRRLRRQRRRPRPPRPLHRRRRLQVHRRRQDLDPPRPARHPADRPGSRRPHQRQHRLHRGRRPPLRPQQRARPLQIHRRRRNLQARPLHQRPHRSLRSPDRSAASQHRLRRHVATSGRPVGERLLAGN